MGILDHLKDVPMDEEPARDDSAASASPIQASETDDATPKAGSTIAFGSDSGREADADPATPLPHDGEGGQRRRRRGCGFWGWFFLIVILALGVTFWIRYYNPYVTDAQVRGYVERVERRGIIFKTFEGELIRKSALDDTTRVYSRDFSFSIENDSLAHVIQSYAGTRQLVIITYRSYYGALPWRGASRNVAEAVEKDW